MLCYLILYRNTSGQTPLDLAYQEEHPDITIVLYLIEKGADVCSKPVFKNLSNVHHGFNFLECAIERKHRLLAHLFH